jgi:hypothetical protein
MNDLLSPAYSRIFKRTDHNIDAMMNKGLFFGFKMGCRDNMPGITMLSEDFGQRQTQIGNQRSGRMVLECKDDGMCILKRKMRRQFGVGGVAI